MPHSLDSLRSGALAGATRLDLTGGLTEFPPEIFDLADSLEILNLSGNHLHTLPPDLPRLTRLRILFCSQNHFTELPPCLGHCESLRMIGFKSNAITSVPPTAFPPNLRWLILTDNHIAELPPTLGHCSQLQKLMLAGNRLTHLPDTLAACSHLELLRIAANAFTHLPSWLLQMPRLAWLAFGGNPCCPTPTPAPLTTIHWSQLHLRECLGQGASGTIHRADWHPGTTIQPVAVKLFKGTITSDGLPASELDAALAAGRHPHLIPLLGRLHGHPDGTQGLVMDLIDPRFQSLAAPPDLHTCTRDVYPPDLHLSSATALRIAHSIATAAAHLHTHGLHHGDLYAHNILWHPTGHAYLGDFGAASPCPPHLSTALQQLEVRAYGCLLEELLTRSPHCPHLASLRDRCLSDLPLQRPPFAEIVSTLTPLLHNPTSPSATP